MDNSGALRLDAFRRCGVKNGWRVLLRLDLPKGNGCDKSRLMHCYLEYSSKRQGANFN